MDNQEAKHRLGKAKSMELLNTIKEATTSLINDYESEHKRLLEINNKLEQALFKLSHELRLPITSAMGLVDILLTEKCSPEQEELLELTQQSLNHADVAIHSLYDLLNIKIVENITYKTGKIKLKEIMLVDDDEIFNFITKKIFQRIDPSLVIHTFSSASNAADYISQNRPKLNALFLDISMPEVNGWSFIEQLKELGYNVDVYILTSSTDPKDLKKAKSYNMVKGFFTKPLTLNVLKEHFIFNKI